MLPIPWFSRGTARRRSVRSEALEHLEDRTLLSTVNVDYRDLGLAVAVDSMGDVYTLGYYHQTADFDPGAGEDWLTAPEGQMGYYLAKYSDAGPSATLVWAKALDYSAIDLTIDDSDHLYLSGGTSIDNLFLQQVDTGTGDALWTRATGGYGQIATDATGIYMAGNINGTVDFDPANVRGDDTLTSDGQDGFVAKWDLNGNFLWVRALGGPGSQAGKAIATDGTNVYVAGILWQTLDLGDPNLPVLYDQVLDPTYTSVDGFVAKLDSSGNFLDEWQFADLQFRTIAADATGVYLGGNYINGQGDPGPAVAIDSNSLLAPADGVEAFIIRIDPGASNGPASLAWARATAGPNSADAWDLALANGRVYATGSFCTTLGPDSSPVDFDPGTVQVGDTLTASGYNDVFVWALDANSGSFGWVKAMGGSGDDRSLGDGGHGIAANGRGVYTTGTFWMGEADFDPDPNATAILATGADNDAFVSKLLPADGSYGWAFQIGNPVATIDDGDASYSEAGGGWKSPRNSSAGLENDYRYARAGTGGNTARWAFSGLVPGTYEVLATWVAGSNNASNARYTINGTASSPVDQRLSPADLYDNVWPYSYWDRLGTVIVDAAGTAQVELSDQADGIVIADAIRLVRTGPAPATTLSIDDVTLAEGNSGTIAFTFTVTRSGDLSGTTTVSYATADGTATGGDYQANGGTLTFDPGVTTQTITVAVVGDTVAEPDETFSVNLSSATNAAIASGLGVGQILNDDTSTGGKGGGKNHLTAAQAGTGVASLTTFEAQAIATQALALWSAALGVPVLPEVHVIVRDLPGATLGQAAGRTITLDTNAAGLGWFVDPTPGDSVEFPIVSGLSRLAAVGTSAAGRYDLLTALAHEIGHLLGFEHEEQGVMAEALAPGVRQLPGAIPAADSVRPTGFAPYRASDLVVIPLDQTLSDLAANLLHDRAKRARLVSQG